MAWETTLDIAGVTTFICNAFRTNFVFVKVETDMIG